MCCKYRGTGQTLDELEETYSDETEENDNRVTDPKQSEIDQWLNPDYYPYLPDEGYPIEI